MNPDKFSGNFWRSANGIMAVVCILIIVGFLIYWHMPLSDLLADLAIFGLMVVVLCAGFGFQSFYFLLTANHLIVKNQFFFWYEKSYPLTEIDHVEFNTPSQRSDALRICLKAPPESFTANMSKKLFDGGNFSAGSLPDQTWNDLAAALQSRNIPAIDQR